MARDPVCIGCGVSQSNTLAALLMNLMTAMLEMWRTPLFVKHLADKDVTGERHFLSDIIEWVANVFSAGAGDRLDAFIDPNRKLWDIGMTIGLWALAILFSNLISRINIEYNRRVGENVLFPSARRSLHLQRLSMSYYDKTKFGRILSYAGTSDIDALANPIIS